MSSIERSEIQAAVLAWRKPQGPEEVTDSDWIKRDEALTMALLAVGETVSVEKPIHAVYVCQPGELSWLRHKSDDRPQINPAQAYSTQSPYALETSDGLSQSA